MRKGINEILSEAYEEKARIFIQNLYLNFQKLNHKGGLFITDFLYPQEQYYFQEISYLFSNLYVRLEGGISFCDRKRGFITDKKEILDYLDLERYFIGVEITPKERLSQHSLMENLIQRGIDEGKLGDIWSIKNKIQIICGKEIEKELENFLKEFNIEFNFIPLNTLIPKRDIKILRTTESSLRLDSISSFTFNISRSRMQELIKNGLVMVNNKIIKTPHHEIKEEDIIFIKNLGYFKIKSLKETKRGKYQIEVEKH